MRDLCYVGLTFFIVGTVFELGLDSFLTDGFVGKYAACSSRSSGGLFCGGPGLSLPRWANFGGSWSFLDLPLSGSFCFICSCDFVDFVGKWERLSVSYFYSVISYGLGCLWPQPIHCTIGNRWFILKYVLEYTTCTGARGEGGGCFALIAVCYQICS